MNTSRSRSSLMLLSIASKSGSADGPSWVSRSRPISVTLRSSVSRRRNWSMARRLAMAMSQAPGLSGTPDSGHCSSAATSASCANSSARPTSCTILVSPAINRADSIRHTASIARLVSSVAMPPIKAAS
jgi:hypothetical protein